MPPRPCRRGSERRSFCSEAEKLVAVTGVRPLLLCWSKYRCAASRNVSALAAAALASARRWRLASAGSTPSPRSWRAARARSLASLKLKPPPGLSPSCARCRPACSAAPRFRAAVANLQQQAGHETVAVFSQACSGALDPLRCERVRIPLDLTGPDSGTHHHPRFRTVERNGHYRASAGDAQGGKRDGTGISCGFSGRHRIKAANQISRRPDRPRRSRDSSHSPRDTAHR